MLLSELRSQGLAVTADGDRVRVAGELTDALRASIRRNKATLLRELTAEAEERRAAILAARDAADLDDWRAPLILGRLHLCGNCARYTFGADLTGLGACALHGDGLLAFAAPFDCADFSASAEPTAPEYLPGAEGA